MAGGKMMAPWEYQTVLVSKLYQICLFLSAQGLG